MELIEALAQTENLDRAWHRVSAFLRSSREWHDSMALARFELNYDRNIQQLRRKLLAGTYSPKALIRIPYPKKGKIPGSVTTREYFEVAVEDQIVSMALLNSTGLHLDPMMPAWSYGNRLHRAAWYEAQNGSDRLRLGPYRTSTRVYRTFGRSWPTYRKHILRSALRMAGTYEDRKSLDPALQREEEAEENLSPREIPEYVTEWYWGKPKGDVYWAGFDLEKFYPTLDMKHVRGALTACLSRTFTGVGEVFDMVSNWFEEIADKNSTSTKPTGLPTRKCKYPNLPTGLIASGYLANVALLPIDSEVNGLLKDKRFRRRLAHFRYVDDHVVLCNDFVLLREWIERYETILSDLLPGVRLAGDKTEPRALADLIRDPGTDVDEAMRQCRLNPRSPTPLLTSTIRRVSAIAKIDLPLISPTRQEFVRVDLEQLMMSDIPEQEIPEKTRVSFAANKLATLASTLVPMPGKIRIEKNHENGTVMDRGEPIYSPCDDLRAILGLIDEAILRHPENLNLWYQMIRVACLSYEYAVSQRDKKTVFGLNLVKQRLMSKDINGMDEARPYIVRFAREKIALHIANLVTQAVSRQAHAPVIHCLFMFVDECVREDVVAWAPRSRARDAFRTAIALFQSVAEGLISRGYADEEVYYREVIVRVRNYVKTRSLLTYEIWWGEKALTDGCDNVPSEWMRFAAGLGLGGPPDNKVALMCLYPHRASELWSRREIRAVAPLISIEAVREVVSNPHGDQLRLTRGYVSVPLKVWARLCSDRTKSDPHFPVCGEWMALKLVEKLCQALSTSNIRPEHLNAHNVVVRLEKSARGLFDMESLTWEGLRSRVSDINVGFSRRRVSDSRVGFYTEEDDEWDLQIVFGCGMILLGLLNRSFDWPAIVNLGGSRYEISKVVRGICENIAVSSYSLALLEGMLSPRNRETAYLVIGSVKYPFSPDWGQSVPLIQSHHDVAVLVRRACKRLEDFQSNIGDDSPRQMFPIELASITRDFWSADLEGPDDEA